jgi:manganese/zinc/iron transport system substrate-binding protein
MKKLFSFLLIIPIILIASCNNKAPDKEKSGRLRTASTITIINDIVKNIGGDKVETYSICGVGVDPHIYKAKPNDPKLISESDVVFINGLGLEHWIEEMIRNSGGEKTVVTVTEGITPMTDEKGYGDPDPHAWFNVEYVKTYAKNVAKGLIAGDKQNEKYYNDNLNAYLLQLDSLNNWIKTRVQELPENQRVLITSHDAFRYFGQAYGFEVRGLQGISTEAKIQTDDVKKLVDFIKERKLKSVFIETSVNPKLLEQISSETGAKVGGVLYSDSIGNEGTEDGTYIGAVKHNVNTIVNSLK